MNVFFVIINKLISFLSDCPVIQSEDFVRAEIQTTHLPNVMHILYLLSQRSI
jgi:hypothetical protein